MPNKIANRVKMTVSGTPGTGTITLGSAVAGFQSFAGAGVSNSDTVPYVIEDGSSWELGVGTYTATGTSLSRSVTASSNSGNPINATSAAIVMISPLAADLQSGTAANNLVRLDGSSKLPAVNGSALTGVVASSMAASGLTGTLGVASGGTGLTSLTAGYIPYGNGTGAFSSGSGLTYDGTTLTSNSVVKIAGSSNPYLVLNDGTYNAYLQITGGVFNAYTASIPMTFSPGGSEKVRFDASGNVCIGTISAYGKLNLVGGRAFFMPNSETFALGLGYSSSTGGYYYLGATNSATPDLVFSQTGGSERMRLTNDGNLGLGVTPNAWATFKAIQVGPSALSLSLSSAGDYGVVGNNIYYNGGWLSSFTGYKPSAYMQISGAHSWYTSSTNGTAGSAVTWSQAMTLTAAGELLVGTTSADGLLTVAGVAKGGIVHRKGTYTAGSTTPSVAGISYLSISNSSATTITNFTNGVDGQIIYLYFNDTNTTINRNNAYLAGGANFVSTASDTLVLMNASGVWVEVSRSANS